MSHVAIQIPQMDFWDINHVIHIVNGEKYPPQTLCGRMIDTGRITHTYSPHRRCTFCEMAFQKIYGKKEAEEREAREAKEAEEAGKRLIEYNRKHAEEEEADRQWKQKERDRERRRKIAREAKDRRLKAEFEKFQAEKKAEAVKKRKADKLKKKASGTRLLDI